MVNREFFRNKHWGEIVCLFDSVSEIIHDYASSNVSSVSMLKRDYLRVTNNPTIEIRRAHTADIGRTLSL